MSLAGNLIVAIQVGVLGKGWAGDDVLNDRRIKTIDPLLLGLDVYTWMETDMFEFYQQNEKSHPEDFHFHRDLFAINHSDSTRNREILRPIDVCDFFGALSVDMVALLAKRLVEWRSKLACPLDIVALTTFVPEIASAVELRGSVSNVVVRSLFNIGLFADRLNSRFGQKIRAIEVVAGSRFRDLKVNLPDSIEGGKFQIDLASSDEAIKQLVGNLVEAIKNLQVGLEKHEFAALPPFSIELEPGELFVLNNGKSLDKVAEAIEEAEQQDPTIAGKIGFNLDISHWRIAGISVADVRKCDTVCSRIAHCHVSGHHPKTHIGDTELRRADMEEIREWLQLVRELAAPSNSRKVPFSGWISLEYEAARNTETVADSLYALYCEVNGL